MPFQLRFKLLLSNSPAAKILILCLFIFRNCQRRDSTFWTTGDSNIDRKKNFVFMQTIRNRFLYIFPLLVVEIKFHRKNFFIYFLPVVEAAVVHVSAICM